MRWLPAIVVVASLAACGGGGAHAIPAQVRPGSSSVIATSKTECHFDGKRQVFASGVVRNGGDDDHNVNIEVRFLDADGVRIDLMSDSVSSLQRGESAHWSVNLYPDHPRAVAKCEITTTES